MRKAVLAAALLAAAQGCVTGYTFLSADKRRDAERIVVVEGDRYLRLSYYVTPFFESFTFTL